MTAIHDLSANDLQLALRAGTLGVVEVTAHYLERAERLGPKIGAFTHIDPDRALARARAVQDGPRAGVLWGLPLADKDLERRAGMPTGFGSAAVPPSVEASNGPLAETLDEAGAVSIGKTTTPEFGLSGYTAPTGLAPAALPHDPRLNAGGSSGGAAAAVAARVLPVAPGSDGGGSVRIPAATAGLVGFKPGRGVIPTASGQGSPGALGVAGPLARTIEDAALLLDGMMGRHGEQVRPEYALRAAGLDGGAYLHDAMRGEGRFRVAVVRTSPWDNWCDIPHDAEGYAAVDRTAAELAALGHGVDELDVAYDAGYPEWFATLWRVGAAGIPIAPEREHLLQPLTRGLRTLGAAYSAVDLAGALAGLAEFERRLIRDFSVADVVLTPALGLPPRAHEWYDETDAEANFRQQVQYSPFTSMINVAGLPAVALPVGVRADGLPVGVHLVGRPGGERTLFALGAQLQRRFRWHERPVPAAFA